MESIRLSKPQSRVFDVMKDSNWRTLEELGKLTALGPASAGSRLRDLKLEQFGNHSVEKKKRDGVWHYKLFPQAEVSYADGWDDFTLSENGSEFSYLDIKTIVPSGTNPREVKDSESLQELSLSIAEHGVLEPILVRPIDKEQFEIVAGERRYAAALQAGCHQIPCRVKDYSDEAVLEIQIIENDQREDLNPVEQATGYLRLIQVCDYSVEEIHHRTGKSLSYIRSRLKLNDLPDLAAEALREGRITIQVALLIARLADAEHRETAAKAILRLHDDPGDDPDLIEYRREQEPMTYREAVSYITHEFTYKLESAPFDISDEELESPFPGSCLACPHRSGSQPRLFGDLGGDDVCLNTPCFRNKVDLTFTALKEQIPGATILEGEEAREKYPYGFRDWEGQYNLDGKCWQDKEERSYRELLGSELPPITLINLGNEIIQAIPREATKKLLTGKYPWFEAGGSGGTAPEKTQEEKDREKFFKELSNRLYEKALTAIGSTADAAALGFLATAFVRLAWSDSVRSICKRRGIPIEKGDDPVELLVTQAGSYSKPELLRLLTEMAIVRYVGYQSWGTEALDSTYVEYMKALGVDVEEVKKEVAKDLQIDIPEERTVEEEDLDDDLD